ncbi:MAG: hypothetical protein K2Y21_13270 [Phycisphaerales bacterium]|nr:hypothetical protein [Phycisphaerales bacterium]
MSTLATVIITPHFDEPSDDRAMAARAIAAAWSSEGVRTTVICPETALAPALRPGPMLEVQRVEPPRREDVSFCVRAMIDAWHRERRRPLVAIHCVDDARSVLAAKFASLAGLVSAPVVHVRVGAEANEREAAADALADGVMVFAEAFASREDAALMSMPAMPRLSRPPAAARVFAIPTTIPEARHRDVAAALAASGAIAQGWSIAASGPNGRWILADAAAASVTGSEGDCVTIVTDGPVFPAVALQSIGRGGLAIVHADSPLATALPVWLREQIIYRDVASLASAMRRVATATTAARGVWQQALASALVVSASSFVQQSRRFWRELRRRHDTAAVERMWKLMEREAVPGPLLLEASR